MGPEAGDCSIEGSVHGVAMEVPGVPRRELVVVALGAPDAASLIRGAAEIAARSRAELVGVHVRVRDGVRDPEIAATNARLLCRSTT